MANAIASLLKVLLPKKVSDKGVSYTTTFNPSNTQNTLGLPNYRDHLEDIFTTRTSSDSRALLQQMFVHDPDVSAAVNAFLTVANTEPVLVCRDNDGQINRKAQQDLNAIIIALTTVFDYKQGFVIKPSIRAISEAMRYHVLLRGMIAAELVLSKQKLPAKIKIIEPTTLRWYEPEPGVFKPEQDVPGSNDPIPLDIASFFTTFFRRDPATIYTQSPFVSSINTVAARQQVVNDLYRIMRFTGYPRIDITVLEEVLIKNAPADVRQDPTRQDTWLRGQIQDITNKVTDLRPEQAFVHTDAISATIMNDKNPSSGLDVTSVIKVLDAQNQAALRTMSTILGRGESGVNTASIEARLFSLTAQEINEPVGEILSQIFTMSIRLLGHEDSTVSVTFTPPEMRPSLELESQRQMLQTRLLTDLSHGVITDDEYHLQMYGRIRPDSAPELSGTGFMVNQTDTTGEGKQPSAIDKAAQPEGGKAAGRGGQT